MCTSAAPLGLFLVDVGGVLGRRRGQRIAALEVDALLHVVGADQLAQFGAELVDDLLRRAGRRQQAVMQHGFESGHAGFVEGRHVRQQRKALGAGDRDGAQLAGLDIAERRRQHAERHRHVTAEQIGHQRRRAFVGNDGNVDGGLRLEMFGGHVAAGAERRCADVDLARLLSWRAR